MTTSGLNETLVQRFLSDPAKVEVLAWLNGAGPDEERTLGELPTKEESIALAEEIYNAGAREVLTVDMKEYVKSHIDGKIRCKNAGKLLIALPEEPRARKQVFRWQVKQARSLGFEGLPDTGQKYLFVMLD